MKVRNAWATLFALLIFQIFMIRSACATTEYVQPYAKYGAPNHGFSSDNLNDAVEAERQYMCKLANYTDCKMTANGPAAYGGCCYTWTAVYTFSATRLNPPYAPQLVSQPDPIDIWYYCPTGWSNLYDSNSNSQRCSRTKPTKAECDPCRGKSNEPIPQIGNPIIPSTMVKRQVETDYASGSGTLSFTRTYQSDTGTWTHNYQFHAFDYNRLAGGGDGRCSVRFG